MKQQFQRGDLVHVAKDLGPTMRHFQADVDAIVLGSYADQYGGDDRSNYTLFLKGGGRVSWYHGHQLTLIEAGRTDLLAQWETAREDLARQCADLDRIFANGQQVLENPHGASIQALANCFGLTNLWGSHGEGVTYFANSRATLRFAAPFLAKNDKNGYLQEIARISAENGVA